jgi:fibronectin type 3 domain-containing protein
LTIDLIWQPVDTPHLAGYNVYRETLDSNGAPSKAKARLNQAPVPTPAFHDTTATAGEHYRYSVTAVDIKGNESESAVTTLDPNAS